MNKYYFNCQFNDEAKYIRGVADGEDVNMLEYIYDNKYHTMVKKIIILEQSPVNIFTKIQALNNIDSVFPVDIKTTKLNSEIKELIFKNYKFLKLTEKSSNHLIIKEVYNIFFGCLIINTDPDSKHHTDYVIDTNLMRLIYDFVKNNAIKTQLKPIPLYDTETQTIYFENTLLGSNKI